MKTNNVKNIIIVGLLIALVYSLFFQDKIVGSKTVTSTKKEVRERIDSAAIYNALNKRQQKVKVVLDGSNKVVSIDNGKTKTSTKYSVTDSLPKDKDRLVPKLFDDHQTIDAYRYLDTVITDNATLFVDILSKGKVISTNFKVRTLDSIITTTEKTTNFVDRKSNFWFVEYQRNINIQGFQNAGSQISVDYTFREWLRIGVGGGTMILPDQKFNYASFKIGIRL